MSIVPLLFRDMWNDDLMTRPSRLLDQHFGTGILPEDLLEPLALPLGRHMHRGHNYYRPWRSALANRDVGSTVSTDKDKFQISLDVQQFSPDEITVKTVDDNAVVVEGKHEEKKDEHGYISRHFVRRYVLPKGHDVQDVVSSLSSDGVLTITAPKKAIQDASSERVVPISQTGPARAVASGDQKSVEKK